MKVFQYLLFCITLLTFTSCVYNNLNRNHYLLSPDESLSLTLHGDQKNISYSLTKNGNTLINQSKLGIVADQFEFAAAGTCQIRGLTTPSQSNNGATLVATLKKLKPKAKELINNRVKSIVINKSKTGGSGAGATTLNDGLTYGNYPFGTRVQDETISLNAPDVISIS